MNWCKNSLLLLQFSVSNTFPLTWETQKPNEKCSLLGMYMCSWPVIWQTLFLVMSGLALLYQSFASGRGRMSAKSYSFSHAYLNRSNCVNFLAHRVFISFCSFVKDEFKCVVCRKSPTPFEHFGNMCSSLKPPCVHCQSDFFFNAFIALAHSGTSFMWHSWQGFTS